MPNSGFFITLYDIDTLNLYLDRGIYSFLMPYNKGIIGPRSNHYPALADYSCGREGTHVFFFMKRKIVYGGQLEGSKHYGAYYLNGTYFPIGKTANAPLVWDESKRTIYDATDMPGIFTRRVQDDKKERCQPYLIRFSDTLGLRGQTISSDDLYFELGSYPYPLPSNAIQNMSFCTLTPGEVDILLGLMEKSRENIFKGTKETIQLEGDPIPFKPEYGLSKGEDATTESHLETSVLANPDLLPPILRPKEDWTLCRQIPISPFKPSQMDRADITYYSDDKIREGTIPNTIIELKYRDSGKAEVEQLVRYGKWLQKIVPDELDKISLYLYAPSFKRNSDSYIPREFKANIKLVSFEQKAKRLEDF